MNLEPKYPQGTPEYEAYAKALRAELKLFARGEAPYGFLPLPPVEYRWVTCSRYASCYTALYRHLLPRGGGYLTTLCGSTATSHDVWTSNKTKKECPTCVRLRDEADKKEN